MILKIFTNPIGSKVVAIMYYTSQTEMWLPEYMTLNELARNKCHTIFYQQCPTKLT